MSTKPTTSKLTKSDLAVGAVSDGSDCGRPGPVPKEPVVTRRTVSNSKTKVGQSSDLLRITSNEVFTTFAIKVDRKRVIPGTVISIGVREGTKGEAKETILAERISLSAFTPEQPVFVYKAGAFASLVSSEAFFFVRVDPVFGGPDGQHRKLKKDTIEFILSSFELK
jgi:hypothetical protein